jgi:copper homeostasis protein
MILEVCVDSTEGLAAATQGGADRIELCAALSLGGLTPSPGFMRLAAAAGLPVHAMIRPRAGRFCYSPQELAVMAADIAVARDCGMAGVVLGASLPDDRLDAAVLAGLIQQAEGMSLTLHRAFDLVPDMAEALETAVALGFHRILTSGGAMTAVDGIDRLVTLQAMAAGRIVILPGAGITAKTVSGLARMRPKEVHASCSVTRAVTGRAVDFGFGPGVERVTDAAQVRALRDVLHRDRRSVG